MQFLIIYFYAKEVTHPHTIAVNQRLKHLDASEMKRGAYRSMLHLMKYSLNRCKVTYFEVDLSEDVWVHTLR